MSQNYEESHTDCPETIIQKSKIFDMPKMAKNSYFGYKKLIYWPILGQNGPHHHF